VTIVNILALLFGNESSRHDYLPHHAFLRARGLTVVRDVVAGNVHHSLSFTVRKLGRLGNWNGLFHVTVAIQLLGSVSGNLMIDPIRATLVDPKISRFGKY
jgi:hypothetical protein